MIEKIELKSNNIIIHNFESIFLEKIDIKLLNELHSYNLLKERINSDARKFFFHFIFFETCEYLLNLKNKEKNIIYFDYKQINKPYHILKHFKEEEVIKNIYSIILKMIRLLPIRIYASKYSFDYFNHLLGKNDGKARETLNFIKHSINLTTFEKYTFAKLKRFTFKNNLVFLNQTYFNQLKTKQLLIN